MSYGAIIMGINDKSHCWDRTGSIWQGGAQNGMVESSLVLINK